MEELGGQLRWMSSERQIADGLTKESARALLAARLRHRRLKLTWDPNYVASKKKSKNEKVKAIADTTQPETPLNKMLQSTRSLLRSTFLRMSTWLSTQRSVRKRSLKRFLPPPTLHRMRRPSRMSSPCVSHGGRSTKNDSTCTPNALLVLLMLSMLAMAQGQQCEKGSPKEEEEGHLWMWLAILALIHIAVMTGIYMAGRWSCSKEPTQKKPKTKEAEIQKDEPIVHACPRDLLN